MQRQFEKHIEKLVPEITTAELQRVCASCVFKKLRKKETVLREGEVSKHKIFVISGLLRNFSISANGSEHILRFTDAGNWTADPESYFSGLPTKYNIDAVETAEIAILGHNEMEKLVQTIPALDRYFRIMITTNMGLVQQRVLNAISATPEEKYIGFMKDYPSVFNRVPLHMVASYLGVSRETLTRIRQGLAVGTHGKAVLAG
jgi:CRP-like cAMP-binding protein